MADPTRRVLVAHHDPERSEELLKLLERMGHEVPHCASAQDEVVSRARDLKPDLIISSLRLTDGDAVSALIRIGDVDPLPSIIVTPRSDMASVERALEDHVMAYLVEPVDEDDLRPTIKLVIARFDQFRELHAEVRDLKTALEARKSIEKAKGLLMKRHELDEAAAFRMLQKTATSKRRKMIEIAEAILIAEDLDASPRPRDGSDATT